MDKKAIFTLIIGLALFACSSEPEWRLLGTYQVPDTEVIPQNIKNGQDMDELIKKGYLTEEKAKQNPQLYATLQDYRNYDIGRQVHEDLNNGYVTEEQLQSKNPQYYNRLKDYRKTLNRKVDVDIYIKPKSIMIEGPKRKFWIKWVYKKEQKLDSGKSYSQELDFKAVDCSQKTIMTLEKVYYGPGDIVIEDDKSPNSVDRIIPDTAWEELSEFVCKYKKALTTRLIEKINF